MSIPVALKLEFSLPPSVNHYYGRRGNKTFLKPAGERFRWEVAAAFSRVRRKPMTGRVTIEYQLHPRNNGRCDIDNREKALLDALQCAGVLGDDNQVVRVVKEKLEPRPPFGLCVVWIREL
jgi:Holliday junction resolvase RusA-like endonuclease